MGKIIGYGKLGRSMPLTLAKCGSLGGDVEMVAVIRELALRHPDDTFLLLGRNSGELPSSVGLPSNVYNPWATNWAKELRDGVAFNGLKNVPLTVERQLVLADVFDEIVGETFQNLDAMVMWVGQHGTSNTPIPRVDDPTRLTKPQDWCAWYGGFMLRGINRWRDVDPWNHEEVNLNADSRNRHKMRDLRWPLQHPVLAQFNSSKPLKHHRYGDTLPFGETASWDKYAKLVDPRDNQTWISTVHDTYSRLEVNGLVPGTPFGDLISFNDEWFGRGHFGMFINEARAVGVRPELQRKTILTKWITPLDPCFIHGTWSSAPFSDIIKPALWESYYPKLHSVRCTFTTPSSGSGWATAKPWEAFAAGTLCFFHPAYDTQDNILGDAPELIEYLRVETPEDLARRVAHYSSSSGQGDWKDVITAQRRHFDRAIEDLTYVKMIEDRIWRVK